MRNYHVIIGTESFDLQVADGKPIKERQFNVVVDNTLFNLAVQYQECPPFFRLDKMKRWSYLRTEMAQRVDIKKDKRRKH
ncbi:hypothetical protein [Pectinatus brassicae]|uniref:Uncharacterized protein n=1 Tax=Pectinatus brassicae TaxID=862415 RepID=A0A840UET9_9FIRM|nr:hypothetical protein [Pectinatus brassicae]MBB5335539.1 hypothetical protein [Pectinatus brassicae]